MRLASSQDEQRVEGGTQHAHAVKSATKTVPATDAKRGRAQRTTTLGTLALGFGRDIGHTIIELAAEGRGHNTHPAQGTPRAPQHDPEQ